MKIASPRDPLLRASRLWRSETDDCPRHDRLCQAIDEYYEAIDAGKPLDRQALLAKYADISAELDDCLSNLDFIERATPDLKTPDLKIPDVDQTGEFRVTFAERAHLGDFRILHEIGRGGMGVVYEAEQLSLGRRVALKILPFAAILDKQQLNRFKNEARAAGTLDHPNIVAVHSVGVERGVHYYAMQLVEGQSLAQVIAALQGKAGLKSVVSGQLPLEKTSALPATDNGQRTTDKLTADTHPIAALSTLPAIGTRDFYRTVARLGIQAAEALDHAHQNGILHRDVKPANLLVDETGKLMVTDFGLARIEADAGMTMTGDIMGTLRYMSPEQALANRVVIDQRTDIYSLGATLYELLTLHPVFDGDDRQSLLRQIAFDEPKAPRKTNRQIPAELETIVLKAIRKNPAERYGTAKDLANDLRNFIEDKPIKAKPPTWREQAVKWSRRHPAAVRATLLAALATAIVLGVSIGWVTRDRATRQAVLNQQIALALEETKSWYESDKMTEALSAVKRAEGLLASGGGSGDLAHRVRQWRADLDTVQRLEKIQLDQALPGLGLTATSVAPLTLTLGSKAKGGATEVAVKTKSDESEYQPATFDREKADRAYRDAFKRHGVDLAALNVEQTAERIRNSPIKKTLVAALDDWHQATSFCIDPLDFDHYVKIKSSGSIDLLQIARLADPDPWRDRLRDAIQRDDDTVLNELANEQNVESQPVPTVLLLARALKTRSKKGASTEAEKVLRAALLQRPGEFWFNVEMALCIISSKSLDESIGYRQVAVALRPDSPGALALLASGLQRRGALAEAEAVTRTALRLAPALQSAHDVLAKVLLDEKRYSELEAACHERIRFGPTEHQAYDHLSRALTKQKKYVEAEVAAREAIRLAPSHFSLYFNLCQILKVQQKLQEAEAVAREVVRLRPTDCRTHSNLCNRLIDQKKFEEGEAAAREAIRLIPADWRTHDNLGVVLSHQKKYSEAEVAFREAIRLDPAKARLHFNLGGVLRLQRKYLEVEAPLREAVRLDPKDTDAVMNLSSLLIEQQRYPEAEAALREAVRINPSNSGCHCNLGVALSRQQKYPEAEVAYQEAIRLDPTISLFQSNLGDILVTQKRFSQAEAAFREAIRLDPKNFEFSRQLAVTIAKDAEATNSAARWDEAAAEFAREIDLREDTTLGITPIKLCRIAAQWDQVFDRLNKLRPDDPRLWIGRGQYFALREQWTDAAAAYAKAIHSRELSWETIEYAFLLVLVEDVEGYEQFCREQVGRLSDHSLNGHQPYFISYVCSAGPSNVVAPSRLVEWAAAGANNFVHPSSQHNLGLAQYRAGQYELAIESLKLSNASTKWQEFPKAQNWLVLAMAHHQLGDANEARQCLDTARQKIAQVIESKTDLEEYRSAGATDDWICVHVLLREAETLLAESPMLKHKPPSSSPKSGKTEIDSPNP